MAEPTRSTAIPGLVYRDAPAAIEWLTRVFGFAKHAVHAQGNTVHHAELTLGGGMIMLGTGAVDPPNESDRRGVSLIVADADAVYARARQAGATMMVDIEDKPYGGRGFTCRDPEGYVWHVGTYDPWATRSQPGS